VAPRTIYFAGLQRGGGNLDPPVQIDSSSPLVGDGLRIPDGVLPIDSSMVMPPLNELKIRPQLAYGKLLV
jgi:hypothetical protein